MPRTRGRERLARSAQPPAVFSIRGAYRHDISPGTGIAENDVSEVSNYVQHNEISQEKVQDVRQ